MRTPLTSLVALAAVLALSACGDPAPKPSPETDKPAEQSAVLPQEKAVIGAAPASAGPEASCASTLGEEAAAALVKRCIAVSPATRPPCNVANPCTLSQGEIDRSCAMYGPGEAKPAECAA